MKNLIDKIKDCCAAQHCTDCPHAQEGCNFTKIALEAIAAIEELKAQVPHGEWLEREVIHDRADAKITDWQQAKCSECEKWHTTPYLYSFNDYDFCPNCGAKMEEAQHEGL